MCFYYFPRLKSNHTRINEKIIRKCFTHKYEEKEERKTKEKKSKTQIDERNVQTVESYRSHQLLFLLVL